MNKKILKVSVIFFVVLVLGVAGFVVGRRIVVNFVFDKVYNEVLNEMREDEKKQASANNNAKQPETVTGQDGKKYESDGEMDTPDTSAELSDGTNDISSKKQPKSTTDIAIKRLSELTEEEIREIQALVTSADKAAALSIVKSALTADDKREIKAMLESGRIDYARCKQIASARLSVAQKKQIYAYYEKYAKIYFANK